MYESIHKEKKKNPTIGIFNFFFFFHYIFNFFINLTMTRRPLISFEAHGEKHEENKEVRIGTRAEWSTYFDTDRKKRKKKKRNSIINILSIENRNYIIIVYRYIYWLVFTIRRMYFNV